MGRKLAGIAKSAAMLLMIELLVPGGTLVVLAILLAGGSLPVMPYQVTALLPFRKALKRSEQGEGHLVAPDGPGKMG